MPTNKDRAENNAEQNNTGTAQQNGRAPADVKSYVEQKLAEKEAVQEEICRNLTPLSVRYSDGTSTFSFSTQDAGRELKMSFRRESWRRFQVSVYVFHALDGDTISSPVGVYGYTAVYHPLLRWWRVESDT